MGNVDWKYFGVDSKTQRWILSRLCELLDKGYGTLDIVVHQHKITEVNKLEKERMTEETTPSLTQDGLGKR